MSARDPETERLRLQGEVFRPHTAALLEAAGLSRGMKVLDAGTGAGDVAMIAAELVGPTGTVVGVDVDGAILDVARGRAREAGLGNVTFHTGDVGALDLDGDFDAVVGRFVLMHLRDAAGALRRLAGFLRPGGLVVFQEPYLVAPWLSFPASGTLRRLERARGAFTTAMLGSPWGPDLETGLKLNAIFLDAGLPAPRLRVDTMIGGDAGSMGYRYLAETVRSVLPYWRQMGIEGADEIDPDSLEGRLRAEIGERNGLLLGQPVVGAWARQSPA